MNIRNLLKVILMTTLVLSSLHFSPHEIFAESKEGDAQAQATEPLKNPMYREDVVELKVMLELAGFGSFSNTTYFGPQTEEAIKAFQSYYDLTADGLADAQTIAKLKEISSSSFQNGHRHPDTVTLKEHLAVLGYWDSANPTTLFGSQTEQAVKSFQFDHGLHVSGIAETKTQTKLETLSNAPLQNPMYRQDVVPVKEKLELLGFGSFSKTTYFGPQTEKAIRDFQSYYGLTVDGVVGSNTLSKLNDEASTPHQSGQNHGDTVKLKEYLYTLGFWDTKSGTTLFASQTEKAVKDFQSRFGLHVSGVAESKTWAKLKQEATGSLKNPMYRDDVISLKENLEILGFGSFLKTDYFGPQTERVIRDFQAYYGLSANGVVNKASLDKINELLANPLRNGQRDDRTVTLKEHLYVLGLWDSATGTALYGSQTESAVKTFQTKHSLPVSGMVDSKTWDKLVSEATGPLKNPMYRDDVITLKENLETLGFGSFVKTDYYGPQTARVVRDLQTYYGLSSTSTVNNATKKFINDLIESPFQNGRRHEDTITLKKHLNRLGFLEDTGLTTLYGTQTKGAVEAFQGHFGLVVNGISDPTTWRKIEGIINSPYQNGESHPEISEFKKMLNALGFNGLNLSENFGDVTERRVKEFQEDMGFPVSGILDELSIKILNDAYERKPIYLETQYNITLNEQLTKQLSLNPPPQTDRYASSAAYVRTANLDFSQGGSITGTGVNVRTDPDSTKDNVVHTLSKGTTFEFVKEVKGNAVGGNTVWYEIKYEGNTLYVHSSLASKSSAVAKTTTRTTVYQSKNTSSHVFYALSSGTSVTVVEQGSSWTRISGRSWRNAKSNEILDFLDPQKQDDFQHLVLSTSVNVPASQINNVLNGKGILSGKGASFIKAANTHNVNEIYLISHALLETGQGTSALATGIEVGLNSSGRPVLVTSDNRSSLSKIEKVYNMFGIGAADSAAHRLGATRAYNEGWNTPEKAIIGGAKFIGERYVHNQYQQNTIYKMRWNPANPGYPQYATDMAWAAKQVTIIKSMYNQLSNPIMIYSIPVYRK